MAALVLLLCLIVSSADAAAPAQQAGRPGVSSPMPGVSRQANPPPPTITDLGTLGGSYSVATGINADGVVVGYSPLADGNQQAFLWKPDTGIESLGTLPGRTRSAAFGINASGQVVGSSGTRDFLVSIDGAYHHAFVWTRADGMRDLAPGTNFNSQAYAINASGAIVGARWAASNQSDEIPVRWSGPGAMQDLPALAGGTLPSHRYGTADAINDLGQVAGSLVFPATGSRHAVRWPASGSPQDVGPLGGIESYGWGIDPTGIVVGASAIPTDFWLHAFQGAQDLGNVDLGGATRHMRAMAINSKGVVVGCTSAGGRRANPCGKAFIWNNGARSELNTLLPSGSGWDLQTAASINDAGQIVGAGIHNGQLRGYRFAPFDLEAVAVEVTQAVQDLGNSVPLIAGKRTFVRFHVRASQATSGVTAQLEGFRNGTSLGPPLKPDNNPTHKINVGPTPKRELLDDSFWFELPPTWIGEGDLVLRAEINPAEGAPPRRPIEELNETNNVKFVEPLTFRRIDPLHVRLVDYQQRLYNPQGQPGALVGVRALDMSLLESQLRRMFPISTLVSDRRTYVSERPELFGPDDVYGDLKWQARFSREVFSRAIWYGMVWFVDHVDSGMSGPVFGGKFIWEGESDGIPASYAAGPAGVCHTDEVRDTCAWDKDGSYADIIGAHELGHALNQSHAEFCGARRSPLDFSPPYPYPHGQIGGPQSNPTRFYGFDAGDPALGLPVRVIPPHWRDIMTYCNEQWISDVTYVGIGGYLASLETSGAGLRRAEPARGVPVSARSTDTLYVAGRIDPAGPMATLLRLARQGAPESPPVGPPGPYRLRQLGATGTILAEQAFLPSTGSEGSLRFQLGVAFAPGARRVAVFSDAAGHEIGSTAVSSAPPVVTITQRTGGPSLPASGPVTLAWAGADADGDALRYEVLYTFDDGANWRVLLETAATSATLDAAELEGTGGLARGRFRVLANDGVLTGIADSGLFTVATKPPVPRVISPADGSAFTVGQSVQLIGSAQDFENGTLTDNQLTWRSSRDGPLAGNGRQTRANLSVGSHTLTLRAVDLSGDAAETSVTVTVLASAAPLGPTLQSSPDTLTFGYTRGSPNPAQQAVSIRNLGSGELAWTATSNAPWVVVGTTNGVAPAEVGITVQVATLPPGFTHTAQLTITSAGATGSPRVITIVAQDNNPPTATTTPTFSPTRTRTTTPLPTNTPTPSRTASSTLAGTPTATLTPTPAAIGGRGLTLQAGGSPVLTWQPGATTGTLIIRWNATTGQFAFLPSPVAPLPGLVGTYTDTEPLPDPTYCYVLLVLGGSPPSIGDVRGLSDMHCIYPASSGSPPGQFRVRLNEGQTAFLDWFPPGGQTRYELHAIRFDGTPPRIIDLGGAAVSHADAVGSLTTCYRLVAFNGNAEIGSTAQLCAAPGIASFPADTGRELPAALDYLRQVLAPATGTTAERGR